MRIFISIRCLQLVAKITVREQYLCSVSTLNHILHSRGENGERGQQRPAQHHAVPRQLASAPCDVWTWDISELALVRRGIYVSLYVVLDLFGRFVGAWMVARKEKSDTAMRVKSRENRFRGKVTTRDLRLRFR